MIQIKTASHRTDPSDYWDEFRVIRFVDSTMEKERKAYIARSESIEAVIEAADNDYFIIKENPETMYDHPNADVTISVYDGYVE